MRTPASTGPSTSAMRIAACSSAFASPSTPSSSPTISGRIAALETNDGVPNAPTAKTSTSSSGKESSPAAWSRGTAAMSGARQASATSIVRRSPTRPTRLPEAKPTMPSAAASTATTMAIFVAEPVVVTTNQGSATHVICDPAVEITSRASSASSARSRSSARRVTRGECGCRRRPTSPAARRAGRRSPAARRAPRAPTSSCRWSNAR